MLGFYIAIVHQVHFSSLQQYRYILIFTYAYALYASCHLTRRMIYKYSWNTSFIKRITIAGTDI